MVRQLDVKEPLHLKIIRYVRDWGSVGNDSMFGHSWMIISLSDARRAKFAGKEVQVQPETESVLR
jgi:hypothetical protein